MLWAQHNTAETFLEVSGTYRQAGDYDAYLVLCDHIVAEY